LAIMVGGVTTSILASLEAAEVQDTLYLMRTPLREVGGDQLAERDVGDPGIVDIERFTGAEGAGGKIIL